jgi:tRNA threonylcarbamoyl adenosine modification protein YjeE
MKDLEFILKNEDETKALGKKLAKDYCMRPCCILLSGDLGAGKSTLASAIISELCALKTPINSPSYTYINHYDGLIPIYHFDLYRIEDEHALHELGLIEELENSQALRIVEWPERAPFLFSYADIHLSLTISNDFRRAHLRFLKSSGPLD